MQTDRYTPFQSGYRISMGTSREDDFRSHRRPLFPPADKAMLWDANQLEKLERCCFRPAIITYHEPRFILDFHSAGGLLGHLYFGLVSPNGLKNKWLHQWSQVEVSYVDGCMEYHIQDPDFQGINIHVSVAPLADCIGLIAKMKVDGAKAGHALVCSYGGASGFYTPYHFDSPEFTFSPSDCQQDQVILTGTCFELVRDFGGSDPINKHVARDANDVSRMIHDWKAVIKGGSSADGSLGYGEPDSMQLSPAELLETAVWQQDTNQASKINCVAVTRIGLNGEPADIYYAVGMGSNMNLVLTQFQSTWEAACARNLEIMNRMAVVTPDPHLDAAVSMLAFSTEGIWGGETILHGGWSWRYGYLGWRGWYGPLCYGWADRVKKSIETQTKLGLIQEGHDQGALAALIEYPPENVYYNMNEVFLDHVRQYFDYTNDIGLMEKIFPVLESILAWENRRLRPTEEFLYENSLNTWISDSHWYIRGHCTQASAYMLAANRFLADIAKRIGRNGRHYEESAERIYAVMQEKLWMKQRGVFAEYIDTTGNQMLHPEPELATIYHSAEFGAADAFQIYQMLYWAETHLKCEITPNCGKLYWSSNWFPNTGGTYTHSTYEMATGENLNFALTQYMAGRSEEAYRILKGVMGGIYNGPTPGGLSCHMDVTGKQRKNDEFSDAVSMWGRTVMEGLFGIKPKKQDQYIELMPQLPEEWDEASIKSDILSYHVERKHNQITVEWDTSELIAIRFRIPVRAEQIIDVRMNHKQVNYSVEAGICLSWIITESEKTGSGRLEIRYKPCRMEAADDEIVIGHGKVLRHPLLSMENYEIYDPQELLAETKIKDCMLEGQVIGNPGKGILFLKGGTSQCPMWTPVRIHITDDVQLPEPKIWVAPATQGYAKEQWNLIDLTGIFNASSPVEAIEKVAAEAGPPELPASEVGYGYWKVHLINWCANKEMSPSDQAWRNKIGDDGIAWTSDGIPFKSSTAGNNIGVVTLSGGFPKSLEFVVGQKGSKLFMMISGMTFPNQSHVPNLRVTLTYADGTVEIKDLVNPFDIGDCWGVHFGRFHDTAVNGFENIGGRFGPRGSIEADAIGKPVEVDTEAHLIEFILRDDTELRSVRLDAVANDVIFGLMGATILQES